MQEPYKQGRAYQFGPESCAGPREGSGAALTWESSGQLLSSEISSLRVPTSSCLTGASRGQTQGNRI